MKISKLTKAISEAKRFLAAAQEAQDRFEMDWERDRRIFKLANKEFYINYGKENATCKRASLDLTRSLAELRK